MDPDSSRHILRPARLSTVFFSFVGALVLDFMPWPDLRVVPEFAALVLTCASPGWSAWGWPGRWG